MSNRLYRGLVYNNNTLLEIFFDQKINHKSFLHYEGPLNILNGFLCKDSGPILMLPDGLVKVVGLSLFYLERRPGNYLMSCHDGKNIFYLRFDQKQYHLHRLGFKYFLTFDQDEIVRYIYADKGRLYVSIFNERDGEHIRLYHDQLNYVRNIKVCRDCATVSLRLRDDRLLLKINGRYMLYQKDSLLEYNSFSYACLFRVGDMLANYQFATIHPDSKRDVTGNLVYLNLLDNFSPGHVIDFEVDHAFSRTNDKEPNTLSILPFEIQNYPSVNDYISYLDYPRILKLETIKLAYRYIINSCLYHPLQTVSINVWMTVFPTLKWDDFYTLISLSKQHCDKESFERTIQSLL